VSSSTYTTIGDDLKAYLLSQKRIADIVYDRIVQNDLPNIDPPREWGGQRFIAFQRSRHVNEPLLGGGGGGVTETTFEMQVVGTGQADAEELADIVNEILNGFRGEWGQRTILGVLQADGNDESKQLPPGSNTTRNQVALTYTVYSR
jgi:hypothetical protein